MTNEEILEKQVEALEKLLQLRTAIIEELEAKVSKLEMEQITSAPQYPYSNPPWVTYPQIQPQYQPGVSGGVITISNTCPDGTPHIYPQTWGGTNVPCAKCGNCIPGIGTTTTLGMGGSTITTTSAPVHTSGYISPVDGGGYTSQNNVLTLKSTAK